MTISISVDLETWGTTPGSDIRSIGACVFDPASGDVGIPCQTCKGGTTRGNVNDGGDCSDCMNTRMEQGYGDVFYVACDNPTVTPRYGAPGSMDDDKEFIHAWVKLGYIYGRDELENVYLGWEMKSATSYKYPLTRDPRTVQWWSEQSDEAQAAFVDPVDLREALVRFTDWLDRIDPEPTAIRIWSHGAAFDPPILAAAYEVVGLPVPWHYRAPRDTRTLFDAAGIEDHSALLARHPGPMAVSHHALDDAICQARAVCAAYMLLRATRDTGEWRP